MKILIHQKAEKLIEPIKTQTFVIPAKAGIQKNPMKQIMTLKFTIFETKTGWMGIAGTSAGIRKVIFPMPDRESALKAIVDSHKLEMEYSEEAFLEAKTALTEYFDGKRIDFQISVDLDGYTDFQKNVWDVTKTIPYGELRSYSWVASQMGKPKAFRAVGNALGKNPVPIIVPCHRVIGSDGGLHGFTGGLDWKKKLIKLETENNAR